MNLNFKDKTIIISGGTRGIGAAFVNRLSELGATSIIATGTHKSEISHLSKTAKSSNIIYRYLDFTKPDSVEIFTKFCDSLPKIDILINNAGVNKINYIYDFDTNDWDRIIKINLTGTYQLSKTVSKNMIKYKQGKILNIGSIFGVVSKEKRSAYSASKWGVIGFTKSIALDLAPYNILVNSLSPGFIDTDLTNEILGEEGIKKMEIEIPIGRLGTAEEIAEFGTFLISDFNTYTTGQNIIVDGGFTSV